MFEMFGNVLKSLFAGPATRNYPVEKRPAFPETRGQLVGINAETCIYCGICEKKCPALAITVEKPTKTWTMDPYKCVVCGICAEACPKKCMEMSVDYRQPVTRKSHVTQTKPATEEMKELVSSSPCG